MPSSASNLPRSSARFSARRRLVAARFGCGQDLAEAADLARPAPARVGPFGFQAGELFLQRGDFRVDLGDALVVVDAEIAVADERRLLRLARGDRDARVLDQRRRRALADRDARRGGVEQADRLVRQLPRRDVAVRQIDRGDDRGVGDAHLVVLLHRPENAAQHVAAGRDVRLVDLDRLEAPGQRRILLDILPVLRPGGGGDGAQRAARERGLQQIGGVAGAGRAAGADQRMRLVDEQDDRRRRALHLVDHRAQPLLELALHRRAGLHQADVERAEPHAAQRRRDVAGGDALGKAFDDRGLADAGLAGQDRIVLPPAHQHVDDLADFVVAAEDRVHLAGLGLGGQILREAVERGRALRRRGLVARPACRRRAGPSRPSGAGSPRPSRPRSRDARPAARRR